MIVGYGLTESTATVSCTWGDSGYTIGSVGSPMPDVGVKIGENNEVLLRDKTVGKRELRVLYGLGRKKKRNDSVPVMPDILLVANCF